MSDDKKVYMTLSDGCGMVGTQSTSYLSPLSRGFCVYRFTGMAVTQ
jgi:hypothetical protein